MHPVTKNWTALFTTNFLGIFNDNFLKHCIVFIAVTWALPGWLPQSQLIAVVSAALVVPYLLLSPLAGRLAVIHSKQRILRVFKFLEGFIMLVASLAFVLQWVWLAVLAVFLMGFQSCLYSPAKYGLIRDVDGPRGVSFGSGVFETMAFLGILTGTVAATWLSDHYRVGLAIAVFLLVALAGYLSARCIKVTELPEATEGQGSSNPVAFAVQSYRFATAHRYVNSGVLGASVFWLLGSMVQMNLVIHCVQTLGTTNTTAGLVMAVAAIGIALGCTVAGLLAGNTVKPQLIPIGLAGMIVSLLVLLLFNPPVVVCAVMVFVLAFMGGLFEVPCLALVQRADIGRALGNMIAYLNFITFLFVLLGTGLFSVTMALTHDNSLAVFGVLLVVCVLMLVFYGVKYPEFFKRNAVV